MSAEYGWLAELCDGSRAFLAQPFALEWDGEISTIATDGSVLLAVRGQHAADATAEQIDRIGRLRKSLPLSPPRPFSFPAFRQFLGLPDGPTEPCPSCKGKRRLECGDCEGEGGTDSECEGCGNVHREYCKRCGGSGLQRCPACATPDSDILGNDPVRLFGVLFDRRLIVPAIARLSAESVTWQNDEPTQAAIIRADAWQLVIMPLRDDPDYEKYRLAPAFDAAPESPEPAEAPADA